ncbi:hypothetical protein DYY66_1034 [Candidatus Nitrosotalea sp. FS]|uniref:hypothetical protein n=1 Tax=Candidatus Nitrosotalea sp. FS TaxID=2341021 RepID=UPI00140B41D1|nr:hypothetical protein [Candidatus Nitrosotalea sp. FS]NHH98976.1 hypothetical protein [Candidatus Nitrosotalea sp. FS]
MTQKIVLDVKESPTFSEIFTQHVSDISLEVESIKLRNLRNDADGINEHLARIESALVGIMEARLALAEKVLQSQSNK